MNEQLLSSDLVGTLRSSTFGESERQDLEMFFARHLELFFKAVSQLYPIDEALLDRFQGRWEWLVLSMNEALPWTDAFIDRYKDHWHWWRLSSNKGLPWSEDLINCYRDRWDWSELSDNPTLPWSLGFIECYRDKWDWKILSDNESLPWSSALIERFGNHWHDVKVNAKEASTVELDGINRCSDNSKFGGPSQNQAQRWSSHFYEKRANKWNIGKALPSFARFVRQLISEQVVRLLESYLDAERTSETTFAVYNLRTCFLREPGDMVYCPSCGSRIISSDVQPSKTVVRDMSDTDLMPLHYFSRLYLCRECPWWGIRERWGFLEIDSAEYDYLIAGMAEQKDLAGKRATQPWQLALENESYLSTLPLPYDWRDLFGPFHFIPKSSSLIDSAQTKLP